MHAKAGDPVPFNSAEQQKQNVTIDGNTREITETTSAHSGALAMVENRDYTAINVRDANPRNAMASGTVHTPIATPQHTPTPKVKIVTPKLATGPPTHSADHDSLNKTETVVSNPNSNVSGRPELR